MQYINLSKYVRNAHFDISVNCMCTRLVNKKCKANCTLFEPFYIEDADYKVIGQKYSNKDISVQEKPIAVFSIQLCIEYVPVTNSFVFKK